MKAKATFMKIGLITSFLLFLSTSVKAQIGYQVSLLNTATGEPQANVTVNATVTITDATNGIIYTGTQQATSNEFGVLSLTVGDENTFKDVDSGKMPFFIEVQVNGVTIGKSQILNVPVAEIANKLKSSFTKEDLIGNWVYVEYSDGKPYTKSVLKFNTDDTITYTDYYFTENGMDIYYHYNGKYEIEGNNIYLFLTETMDNEFDFDLIRWREGCLYFGSLVLTKEE